LKNFLQKLALLAAILACACGVSLAQPLPPLDFADFYNLYLEQAIDAGRPALRRR